MMAGKSFAGKQDAGLTQSLLPFGHPPTWEPVWEGRNRKG